jgi:hypothetical protein
VKRMFSVAMVCLLCLSMFTVFAPKASVSSDLLSLPAAPYTQPPYQLANSTQSLSQLVSVSSQSVNAASGQTVSLTLTYEIAAVFNPSEIDQLFFVESWTPAWPPNGYTLSVYNGIPGTSPGVTGTETVSFTAPSQSGTYYLWFCFDAQYSMADAINARTSSMVGLPGHIKVVVSPGPTGQCSLTVVSAHGSPTPSVGSHVYKIGRAHV